MQHERVASTTVQKQEAGEMIRTGLIRLALVASLGAVALAGPAPASAASWHVGEAPVESGKLVEVASKTATSTSYVLSVAEVTVTCTSFTLGKAFIDGPSTFEIGAPSFGGCTVAPKSCTLSGGGIPPGVEWIDLPVPLEKGGIGLEFPPPEPEEPLLAPKFEGSSCPLKGEQRLTGKVTSDVASAGTEATSHEFVFNSKGELKLGAKAVTLTGGGVVKLASGKAWSYR